MNPPEIPIVHKKPVVAYIVQFIAACSALVNAIYAVSILFRVRDFPLLTIIGAFTLSAVVAATSARVFLGLGIKPFKKRSTISLYLWFMLFLYPITNVLRSFEAYTPAPYIENNQLLGAFIAEIMRYIFYIILIVWVGFSKRLVNFLTSVRL